MEIAAPFQSFPTRWETSARILHDLQHDLARQTATLLGREGCSALSKRHSGAHHRSQFVSDDAPTEVIELPPIGLDDEE